MKDFINRIPTEPNRKLITYSDETSEYVIIENADEPLEGDEGTPINRNTLLQIQGFQGCNTEKNIINDGVQYIETNSDNDTLTTTFKNTGEIIQHFVGSSTITLTTTMANGEITEELS